MDIRSPENLKNNTTLFMEQAWKMLDVLFLDQDKKDLVGNLCGNLPQLAFECQRNKNTNNTRVWLNQLKWNIKNPTV